MEEDIRNNKEASMMVSETEMLQDIKEMIVLIAAFTEPNTQGADLLDSWKKKYRRYMI